jgi:hypothetical protein
MAVHLFSTRAEGIHSLGAFPLTFAWVLAGDKKAG